MNYIDYILLGLLVFSALIGVRRGFVREALSLLAWVAAFWLATSFYAGASQQLSPHIEAHLVRDAISFIALLLVVLMGASILIRLVSHCIHQSALSVVDRILGMLFGLLRGLLVVFLGIFLLNLLGFSSHAGWKHSTVIHYLYVYMEYIQHFLSRTVTL